MTRRELLAAPALLQRARRPSIVFILADDLHYDTFGITGHPQRRRASTASARDSFAAEYFEERTGRRVPNWQAIRSREWKYIHYRQHPEMDEIYNLKQAPRELSNGIASPELRDQLLTLQHH